MLVKRVINNNVISVMEDDIERVIMGLGIGFQKKPGDIVDENKIEKIFKLDDKEVTDQFKTLMVEVPIEVMQITEDIIQYAKEKYHKTLNDAVYVALTDHINFAITRHNEGHDIRNGLLFEIKKFYRDEFAIGMHALSIIEEKAGVQLNDDEASFIAMHIVNAELNGTFKNVNQITDLIQDVLNIIKYHFKVEFDEDSLNYFRFLTHLKFFAQRMLSHSSLSEHDSFLFDVIREKYPDIYECTLKIETYLMKKYHYELPNEEKLYLTIHIERVIHR
jgi:beta-glucoside operon transcriptional antiterminator